MMRFDHGIGSYTKLFSRVNGGIVILILLCSGILTNITHAQISLKPDLPIINNSTTTTSQPEQQPHKVKIATPTKGQQVQAGKGLAISGTSDDNATPGCQVSVIVNGIKPYQNATPSSEPNDYSKWSFMLAPKYTPLKEGQNKITAKFSCGNDPRSISHNSVNVTGVSSNTTTSVANTNQLQKQQKQQPLPIQTTRAGTNFTAANATSAKTSVPVLSNASSYLGGEKNNTIRVFSVSTHVGKNTIHPGERQTITFKVTDTNTTNAIAGAKITGSIMNPSGSSKKNLDGITDASGEASYSWTVGHNDATGRYKVDVQVSASGYENNTASKSFKVVSISVSSSNNNNNNDNSVQSNSGNSDSNNNNDNANHNSNSNNNRNHINNNNHSHNHPSTIISLPHIRIPEVRIPIHLPFH